METSDQKKAFEKKIIEKAMKDDSFRKHLLENTRDAIEQELGLKVPSSVNIKILEENAGTVYIVLPPSPTGSETGELSEAELQSVSGGDVWSFNQSVCICEGDPGT
jgi:hypothetical protein